MWKRRKAVVLSVVVTFAGLLVIWPVWADPLPGRDILKFQQLPMLDTPIMDATGQTLRYHGHDELSTAWSFFNQPQPGGPAELAGYRGEFMADDFADRFDSPVVHVKWWGSYLNRPTSIPPPVPAVNKFLISFESDIPAGTGGANFSRPGTPLLNQVVTLDANGTLTPGEGTFLEKLVFPTSVDGPIYEYNAELHLDKSFFQEPDTVYWLKIVALVDVAPGTENPMQDPNVVRWGWHNRDYTIKDPLASVPPAVVPGEHLAGAIGTATEIWHFQDDSVDGLVEVRPSIGGGFRMPDVVQDVRGPQRYLDLIDGPQGIGQFSKDLAFELYTVPEPTVGVLMLLTLGVLRRRAQA